MQKYMLRQNPEFANVYLVIYPQIEDLIQSTAAARVNGYLGGYGDCEQLKCEVRWLGMMPKLEDRLLKGICRPRLDFQITPYALHSGAMPANQI